ncbi:flagellar hook capping FlgD N-terminal domain-containing protein [Pseudogemmobacter sonorensis]|uniref:flagellar hook capping FlgD N-terminal domain-containing protein n=1 Tax=Pseudogemmobacter sonorensis TaxID=2989681 RepID=UPI0036AE745B
MTVTATNAFAAASTGSSTPSGAVLSSDFQTFLRMLTVQMQNQDPLNPIESTDYAVQLATFSGVEQQVLSNQILSAMSAQFSMIGMSQMAGWVGQEARAAADVWYSGSPVTLSPNPVATADRVVLVVRDGAGNTLSREEIPVAAGAYDWFGADATGERLAEGLYSLSVESWRGGELLREDAVEYYGTVTEARGGASGTVLVLEGGIEVAASAVTALRLAR